MQLPPLPIAEALPSLRSALAAHTSAVLQAPPGAGKTTIVPLALRTEPWLAGRRIIMLEPRRLAARAAAHRMAHLLGEQVGALVGYRVRHDTRVGAHTQIEVVTEGVLTRMLASDPTLDGTGLVIFDEFHERSLHADVGLALARYSQQLVRPDLRLLVMSATLDGARVAHLLDDAPVVASEGRSHPVEITWLPRPAPREIEGATAAAVRRALREQEGDVLVFLPGRREIHRVAAALDDPPLAPAVDVHLLFGDLPFDAQDRAIAASRPGRRKVVLSTAIAESSLTIEGVRAVVDSGLARTARFSPAIGMTRLETVRVSRASAEQRAGRAGRLAPGRCYRLWTENEHAGLVPFTNAEILEADLAPLALDLAAAGIRDVAELSWLDLPPAASLAGARELLRWLGALDDHHRLTEHGRRLAELPTHPRLAHMLLHAAERGLGALACDVAALLDDRDVLRADGEAHDADLATRVELLHHVRRGERLSDRVAGMRVSHDGVRRAVAAANVWRRTLGIRAPSSPDDVHEVGRVLALAYPDRIGERRDGGGARYLLRNGTGAVLRDSPALAQSEWIVVAESDGRRPESAIFLAAATSREVVVRDVADQIEQVDEIEWDSRAGTVRAERVERLGALTLRRVPLSGASAEVVAGVVRDAVRASRLQLLTWNDAAIRLRQRLAFVHHHDALWLAVTDDALLETLDDWLTMHLTGVRRAAELAALDVAELLRARLSWTQRSALDRLAPTHFEAPTGSRLPIDYADPAAPTVSVRLQELFGCTATPLLMDGRVPLTLQLLSPAHRPVQVTRDLAGFWRNSYFDVRRELKGRYPRHPWPDDPLQAAPTRRAKPRGS